MRIVIASIIAFYVSACGVGERVTLVEQGKKKADYVINNLTDPAITREFPQEYFPREQTAQFLNGFKMSCNWNNKRGKYVDFATSYDTKSGNSVAFIYEYLLDCDSLRFLLHYKMVEEQPQLWLFQAEQIEVKNRLIIDPSKQLLFKK